MKQTKRQIWDQVVSLLNFEQYKKTMGGDMAYDSKFKQAMTVTKSKRILALCEAGLKAPVSNNPACNQCGVQFKPYFLKDSVCNGCRNPHLIVEAV